MCKLDTEFHRGPSLGFSCGMHIDIKRHWNKAPWNKTLYKIICTLRGYAAVYLLICAYLYASYSPVHAL